MERKRNRQADLAEDGSEESTESFKGNGNANYGDKCIHVSKAFNQTELRKVTKKCGIKRECANCEKENRISPPVLEEGIEPCPPGMWMCLSCGNQACSQNDRNHAKEHYKVPRTGEHCLVIDTAQWKVWCYKCDKFVNTDEITRLSNIISFLKKSVTSEKTKTSPKALEKEFQPLEKGKQKVLFGLTKVVGLTNLGNTCFLNAVLQCLAQTPFLVKVLEDLQKPAQTFVLPGGKYKSSADSEEIILPPIKGTLEQSCSFTQVLQQTLMHMQNSNSQETYKPSELLNAFKEKSSQCMDGGQHDSHEFLRHLLELVRGEDLRRYQVVILKELDMWKSKNKDENQIAKVKFYGHQASARLLGPEPVFKGFLVSTLECLECHHSSPRTEPFLDLSLPVMADKPQPPVFKRKSSGFEDAFDLMNSSNSANKTPDKREIRAGKKAARKELKLKNKLANSQLKNTQINDSADGENSKIEKSADYSASVGSDSDVEDNVETESGNEPILKSQEILESGYSSEKPSTLASPASPEDSQDTKDVDSSLNLINNRCSLALVTKDHFAPVKNGDSAENANSEENSRNEFNSDNPADNWILVSPDEATGNLICSSNNSVESPSSPVEKEVNEEKVVQDSPEKIAENGKTETEETQDLNDRICGGEEEPDSNKISPEKKCNDDYSNANGVGKIATGLSRLGINSNKAPSRYVTCEGELSIQSCLNQFTAQELMAGNNVVGCEACTAKENKGTKNGKMVCTPSTKQYLISEVPAVLILHLKRFQSHRIGFSKVTKQVKFPSVLDLAPVCKNHNKPKIYSLYGVVEHGGTLYGGHYVAYVKTRQPLSPNDPRWSFLPKQKSAELEKVASDASSQSESEEDSNPTNVEPPPGRWYYISDSRVTEVDESKVLQSQAYLLFYERIL